MWIYTSQVIFVKCWDFYSQRRTLLGIDGTYRINVLSDVCQLMTFDLNNGLVLILLRTWVPSPFVRSFPASLLSEPQWRQPRQKNQRFSPVTIDDYRFSCMCNEINEMFTVYTCVHEVNEWRYNWCMISGLTLSTVLNTQNSQVNTTKASLCNTDTTVY